MRDYTWEDIEKFLKEELKDKPSILTFGTIGSRKIERDMDIIITKNNNAKLSDFYKEIHGLFDELNDYMNKNFKSKLIRFSAMVHEEEVKELSNYDENKDLLFHVMTYVSFNQIIKHWTPNVINKEETIEVIKKHYECLKGNKEDLFNQNKFPLDATNEYLLLYMNDLDRINSNMPIKTRIKSMNLLYDYILRKRINQKVRLAKNEKELREIFYYICDILDKK